MTVRFVIALLLSALFGAALARFAPIGLIPNWWQMGIASLVWTFVAMFAFTARAQVFVALGMALVAALVLDFVGQGQNLWVDLFLWGAVCGILGPVLASIGWKPESDTTSTSVTTSNVDRCTTGTGC